MFKLHQKASPATEAIEYFTAGAELVIGALVAHDGGKIVTNTTKPEYVTLGNAKNGEVVAVKRASMKGVACPFTELIGKHNNPVPISIATTKLNRSKCVVDKDNLLFIILFSPFLIDATAFIIIKAVASIKKGEKRMIKSKLSLSTTHLLLLSFVVAILIGTGLLCLPISSVNGQATPFIDALFTATTSPFFALPNVTYSGLVVLVTILPPS